MSKTRRIRTRPRATNRLSVSLTPRLLAAVAAKAKQRTSSASAIVREALDDWFTRQAVKADE